MSGYVQYMEGLKCPPHALHSFHTHTHTHTLTWLTAHDAHSVEKAVALWRQLGNGQVGSDRGDVSVLC